MTPETHPLIRKHCFYAVAIATAIMVSRCVGDGQAVFQAGAATADLTPEAGVSLDGPISKPGPSKGVHDRLTARAVVLSRGSTSLAIVINDMCMIDREVYDSAKKKVFEATGLPPHCQLMAATHSHATPRVVRISNEPADDQYRLLVSERIAQAVINAFRNREPARVGFGTFECNGWMDCRRVLCEPGSVSPDPFGGMSDRVRSVAGSSSDVIRPAGPVDPEFSFLSLQAIDGRPLAVLGNLSVHYCGGYAGGLISADYFGYFARRLEERLQAQAGPRGCVGIMSNATSGDIGSFARSRKKQRPWERMQDVGRRLADMTFQDLQSTPHSIPGSLAVVSCELKLGVRKPTAKRLAWAKSMLAGSKEDRPHRWSRIYAKEALHLATYPDTIGVPLQALRIGRIGVAAAPCEVFAETGLAIKNASPFKDTFVIELANGYGGYLPTLEQHQWGGYETWPARSSYLEVTAEQKIRKQLLNLLKDTARIGNQNAE